MRTIALIAAVAALSACSQGADEAPAPTETTDAMATPTAPATMAAADMAGTYDVTNADGTKGTTTINADGTYVDTDADGKESMGTWAQKDGKTCFTPEGGTEMCWTDGEPAADGSWVATADDGTTVTVMKKPAA